MSVGGAVDHLRTYGALLAADLRAQLQYRASFVMRAFADFFVVVSDFAPVYLLSRHFGAIDGWSFAELGLLYGMVATAWGVIECAGRGFEDFAALLLRGDLDRLLLRPRPIWLQVATRRFEARKLARVAQAMLVLAVAGIHLSLSAAGWAWVALGCAGGVMFFAGVVMAGAASQFYTLGQTAELQNVLTYGGSAALVYPVSIYASWFRRVVTYVVPLAFVNYFPALAALGRVEAAGWPAWLPFASPWVCGLVLALGALAFAKGLRRYESTGS